MPFVTVQGWEGFWLIMIWGDFVVGHLPQWWFSKTAKKLLWVWVAKWEVVGGDGEGEIDEEWG